MEQQLAASLGEGEIAELVEDQEVEAAQEIRSAPLAISAGFGVEFVHEVDDVEESAALATADAGPGHAHGKMGFAGPGAADQHDVALMCKRPISNWSLVFRPYQGFFCKAAHAISLCILHRYRGDGHIVGSCRP